MIKLILYVALGFIAGKIVYDKESNISKIANNKIDEIRSKASDLKDTAKEAADKASSKLSDIADKKPKTGDEPKD